MSVYWLTGKECGLGVCVDRTGVDRVVWGHTVVWTVGCTLPHMWWPLQRAVRILLECILVKLGTYFGWFEWILVCEVNIEEEDPALVDWARGPEDRRHPLVQVVALGSSAGNKNVELVFLNHFIWGNLLKFLPTAYEVWGKVFNCFHRCLPVHSRGSALG